jgi:hypothetical protein
MGHLPRIKAGFPADESLRIVNFMNYPKLLVLAPIFGVASTATDEQYATVDAP